MFNTGADIALPQGTIVMTGFYQIRVTAHF